MLKDSAIADNLDVLLMIERLDDRLQLEVAHRIKNGYAGKIRHLIKEIQNEIKQNEILKQLDDYKNSQQEGIQLYHGDFRQVGQQIPDQSIYWDGRTELGEKVSSGTYFYTIQTDQYSETRKMVILK